MSLCYLWKKKQKRAKTTLQHTHVSNNDRTVSSVALCRASDDSVFTRDDAYKADGQLFPRKPSDVKVKVKSYAEHAPGIPVFSAFAARFNVSSVRAYSLLPLGFFFSR